MNFSADTTSGEEGVALFRAIRERHADLPVILLTAWTQLETAVELVKAGAADYLAKPWDDTQAAGHGGEPAGAGRVHPRGDAQRGASAAQRRDALAARYELGGLVFASDAMARTLELACQVARSDVPVLITGPERHRQGAHRRRSCTPTRRCSAARSSR